MTLFDIDLSPYVAKYAGIAGSVLSYFFIKGRPVLEKFGMVLGGAVLSLVGSEWLAAKAAIPLGLSGFLVGLFGMALTAKIFEAIAALNVNMAWTGVIGAIYVRISGKEQPPAPAQPVRPGDTTPLPLLPEVKAKPQKRKPYRGGHDGF